jgi:ABC-type Fe3+ transport system substrate-binding protein
MFRPAPSLLHALSTCAVVLLTASAARALTTEEIVNYTGPDREQMLVAGAKKEGQVVLYSALIVNQMLRPLTEGFSKKYPFVKMSYWRADSEELIPKIAAEARANNLVADLFEGSGGGEVAVEAGLTLPFTTPVLSEYPKAYLDPKGQLAPTRLSYFSIAYNTKMVAPDKVPKTYEDLLDPQWRGKMAWPYANTGRYLFLTNLRLAWGEERAMAYIQKLAGQKIVNFASGSARTLVDRVIAGEYPIAINIYAHHPLISKAKGAPVNSQLMDPVPSAAGTISVVKGTRHPHAAMLLLDFILSKEGQKIMAAADYFPAHPDVPSSPQLAGIVPKAAGYHENFVSPQKLKEYLESTDQILQTYFR